jgi:hypothetical protein
MCRAESSLSHIRRAAPLLSRGRGSGASKGREGGGDQPLCLPGIACGGAVERGGVEMRLAPSRPVPPRNEKRGFVRTSGARHVR